MEQDHIRPLKKGYILIFSKEQDIRLSMHHTFLLLPNHTWNKSDNTDILLSSLEKYTFYNIVLKILKLFSI